MRWRVTVVAEGDRVVDREEVVELADAVAVHGGIASGIGTASYGAQLLVDADDHDMACELGHTLLVDAAARAGLPAWPVAHVEATSEQDELDDLGLGDEDA